MMTPYIDPHLSARVRRFIETVPSGTEVLFAGADNRLLKALCQIFAVEFAQGDFVISRVSNRIVFGLAIGADGAPGLLLVATPVADDVMHFVPTLLSRDLVRDQHWCARNWDAQALTEAFHDFALRRLMSGRAAS